MADYIDRKSLIDHLNQFAPEFYSRAVELVIEKEFATDVVPIVHAKWEIVTGSNGREYMVCTKCRKQQTLTGVFSYCPNCGAKMGA